MSNKTWGKLTIGLSILLLAIIGGFVIFIDPFFHYHKPLKFLEYKLNNEWYQNDGIARNFDYDAVLTGTSMIEMSKTSEIDEMFGTKSVKIPYAGGSYSQIDSLVAKAAKSNPNLKIVFRGLDFNRLVTDTVDAVRGDVPFPDYLYNDNPFDDVQYILNKDVILNEAAATICYTKKGNKTTNFDDYAKWMGDYKYGKDAILAGHSMDERISPWPVDEEEYKKLEINIRANIIDTANTYPDIDFYYFIPPYSIYAFDSYSRVGELDKFLEYHNRIMKMIVDVPNIKLFSFMDYYEVIENPDNYRDDYHYGMWVNSQLFQCMKNGEHRVTKKNYEEYCKEVNDYYLKYDYDALFE
ncbi:MAG: hypothetical protein K6E79_09215 [Pseudobutyrivibrio sp.]|nr:hypothetical protein [Pseudobutyrivibrio sp.]